MTAQLLLAVVAGPLGVAIAAPLTAAALRILQVLLPPEGAVAPAVLTLDNPSS